MAGKKTVAQAAAPTNPALLDALGADSWTAHKGGFRLFIDGKTVAYGAETGQDGSRWHGSSVAAALRAV